MINKDKHPIGGSMFFCEIEDAKEHLIDLIFNAIAAEIL